MAAGLLTMYERWFAETVRLLELAGYLQRDRERLTVNNPTPVDLEALWCEWDERKQAWLADTNQQASVILVEHCLRALPDMLTGKRQATDIMFPNGSLELVEGIYKGNVVTDYFNEVLGDTVVAYIRERLAREPTPEGIRILEIGAGTGGTTAMVLPKLQPYQAHVREYCYTDISRAFLLHAQREYAPGHPFLTMQLFDVEQSIAAQGIEAGGYDLVIATNVLHATKNIRRTLANAKAALRRGGLLLLNELNRSALFVHLTFGLLEGWWRYEDAALRLPGCPGLAPDTWARVLTEEGFPNVLFPAAENHALGQHIIVAQSDGVICQARGWGGASSGMTQQGVATPNPSPASLRDISDEVLREKSTALLKKIIAETLSMSPRQIDSSVSLEAYGIDSILVIRLTNAFRQVFDRVSSTLFFEVQTIDALVEHFMATQQDALIRLAGVEGPQTVAVVGGPVVTASSPTQAGPVPAQWPRAFNSTRRFTGTDTRMP